MPDEAERQKQLAAEMILDSEGLTDDLQDTAAKRLLAWGITQAERLTEETGDTARAVGGLRRVIKRVNNLVAERAALSDDEFAAELDELVAASDGLLGPCVQTQAAVQSLLAERDGLDDAALVERITALLAAYKNESAP